MAGERRTFSGREKEALYLLAGGQCSICGCRLSRGWHADHIHPYSKGGETDLLNGQALCARCNLTKGDKMDDLRPWPPDWILRKWQENAIAWYNARDQENFMASATPGAGKTTLAIKIAHALLLEGTVSRVVVVCPTTHLCKQWANSAARAGIHLDPTFENRHGYEARDYHGVVVTYQQVASSPAVSGTACRRTKTFVIFDEPHHMGDDKSWGDACRMAFKDASRRLLITGTPFRTDGTAIPFVDYGEDGLCRLDYAYSYADALRDQVCRPVLFPSYEGVMRWFSNGEHVEADFSAELPQREALKRLRAAVSGQGEYMADIFGYADAKLDEVRQDGHPTAGGLIIARDIYQAYKLRDMMEEVSESPVRIAVSDDPNADTVIERFAADDCPDRWLVAVKMVSEGVDIPRLRVGIYATNTSTELFFRQVIGRFVRVQPDLEDQTAYLYIPADPVLEGFAQTIKEERQHQLQEELDRLTKERALAGERVIGDFKVLDTGPARHHVDIYEGAKVQPDETWQARAILRDGGFPPNYKPEVVALIMRRWREQYGDATTDPAPRPREEKMSPQYQQKDDRRKLLARLVSQYCASTGAEHRDVNAHLMKLIDGTPRDKATVEQLDGQINYMRERMGLS